MCGGLILKKSTSLSNFWKYEESRIDPIFKSIEEPIREYPPYSIEVKGVGAFPS